MIEMGDMVCYTSTCPQCNRVPPGRRILSPERKKKYSRRLGRKYPVDLVRYKSLHRDLSTRNSGKISITGNPSEAVLKIPKPKERKRHSDS